MHPVETYLRALHAIRASGVAVLETSYYGALANLLDEIGKTLKPRVRCVLQMRNQGAGLPDGGLFTANQMQKADEAEWMTAVLPERGVLEVKGTSEDVEKIADSAQVERYWNRYGQVLVTNYRDFALVGRDADGRRAVLETYRLAENEATFWKATANPQATVETHGEQFTEYLKRVLLHAAPLTTPEDLAWFLASYARDAKVRVERAELPALNAVREAMEEALGLTFEGAKGDKFFRSTLVQTLFYGVFSAWALWHTANPARADRFDWRTAAWQLRVPMIRALFYQLSDPAKLGPLGLAEVLDWSAAALHRVDRAAFFEKFEESHAVQYFYEPFLQAFDPELRKDLGVWYTPPEIVEYMVARVDTVLKEELGLPNGLADPNVTILDPCCGTGAYLVAVLKRIAATQANNGDALSLADVKKAAMERVFGFEILPAPFVVAHLQLGLVLQNLGAPLSEQQNERAGVYLTNALTGWEMPQGPASQLAMRYPELQAEREAAGHVKRDAPVLVVLGNPPYNAFAGVSPKEEQGLVEPYKQGLIAQWGIKKFNLDDLYVRFFRLAERRIAEMTGKGVVCYISNHSWISDPSFVVLRQHLLQTFDRFWIENMHGNRKISEYAPDGRTSETVFAISGFSVGIQQGVAISLWVKNGKRDARPQVLFRDDLNAAKAGARRAQLLESLRSPDFDAQYQPSNPAASNRYSFRPSAIAAHYQEWPKLTDLCAVAPSNGLMEKRGGALIDIDRSALEKRMRAYFDPTLDWEAYRVLGHGLTKKQARFDPKAARSKALAAEPFQASRIVRYAVRPFDTRWCYYTGVRPVWNEPRPSLWAQCWEGNRFLLTRFNAAKDPEGSPLFFTPHLSDDHFLAPDAVAIPLQLKNGVRLEKQDQATLFSVLGEKPEEDAPIANLSKRARDYLAGLGIANPDADAETAELLWMHALAIGYAPAYLSENADGIRQDWPRIPLPQSRDALLASAALGRQVAALLDMETHVPGVTSGDFRPELRPLCVISRVGGGPLNPDAGEIEVTAGWGHAGKEGVTMPAKGKVVTRDYTPEEQAAMTGSATAEGLAQEEWRKALGETTCDIYLNNVAYWRNVPARVWDYTIGGYPVMKKWLSYRERELLGRSLTVEEAREVRNIARRIAALLLLSPILDANYRGIKHTG